MAKAAYEVNVSGTDDETFAFCISFEMKDGESFPFENYAVEYSLRHGGSTRMSLSEGNGITISDGVVSFEGTGPLCRGEYDHGCRLRHLATGNTIQVFTGSVRIGEGEF